MHKIYTVGKANTEAPKQIKDRNGIVVLEYCKLCGEYEAGLAKPCRHEHEWEKTDNWLIDKCKTCGEERA